MYGQLPYNPNMEKVKDFFWGSPAFPSIIELWEESDATAKERISTEIATEAQEDWGYDFLPQEVAAYLESQMNA